MTRADEYCRAAHAHGVGEDGVGDEIKTDQREGAGDDHAAIQRAHDRGFLHAAHADEHHADNRGDDGNGAEQQREGDRAGNRGPEEQISEQHRGDRRDAVGLEQVGSHAGAIADVVAHVVGDHRRISRVVFGNSGFDFSDQVGADVGSFGVDAAAQTGEDRNQRTAEGQADHGVERGPRVAVIDRLQNSEVARDGKQTEPDHQHAGDRAAAEGDVEGRRESAARRFGGAHVGAHRDDHADEAGSAGENRADQEADGCLFAERRGEENHEREHDRDDADGSVLTLEEGHRAFLDGGGNLAHPLVAGRLGENPEGERYAVKHGKRAAGKAGIDRSLCGHSYSCLSKNTGPERADRLAYSGERRKSYRGAFRWFGVRRRLELNPNSQH